MNNKINFTKANIIALPNAAPGKRVYYYDIKNRGLGISVTSKGVKTFIVYRKVNRRPERIMLGRFPDLTMEQARRKAAAVNGMIAMGQNPNDKRREERKEITFGEVFKEYLERHAKVYKKTWAEDIKQYNLYLKHWTKRKLSTIYKSDIEKLFHKIGRENGTYAANRLLALIGIIFTKAIAFSLWEKAKPTEGIKKFREHSRDRFLQPDEMPRFFKAVLEEPNQKLRDFILIALLTGARRSNIQTMEWKQINFTLKQWRIPETKNGLPQTVALTDEALEILKIRKEHSTSNYVFPGSKNSGHLVEPRKAWERILKRAEITDFRIHDLRRTLGSWQARTGASLSIIGKSLNHKSPQTTAIYARLDLDPVRVSVAKATTAMLAAARIPKYEAMSLNEEEEINNL